MQLLERKKYIYILEILITRTQNKSLYVTSSPPRSNSSLRSSEITIQSLSLETEKGTTIVGDTRRSDIPCSISLSIDQKPPRPPFRNLSLERVSSGPVFLEDRCPSRSWHGLRGRPGAGARGISRPGCDIDRSNAPREEGWVGMNLEKGEFIEAANDF